MHILHLHLATHILLSLGTEISGICGIFFNSSSASALVRAFLDQAVPPGMALILMPFVALDVTSSEVGSLLSVATETDAFIPVDDVIKPRFGNYDITIKQSDWLPGNSDWLLWSRAAL